MGTTKLFAHFDRPIINAYTESVSHPAKDMNRMGRDYSFEMKLLYDAKARKDDPVIEAVEVDDEQPSPHVEFQRMTMIPMHQWELRRMVEHASGLSTCRRLPEEGHFGSRSV
ncbi:hypothetical protein EBB59_08000 [Lysobacter pythonis]|uniref:Uncharacterized protein n=1 Tax=Solilutibacter pythonis TaxID=2483112 RepID=A0A3M2HV38_9GAMM|nr:hypothetical protein [Lysobacter pythonis]RMH92888.1 hypothetical protein EBB59_08000 [Lysobacter pythonis]